MPSSPRSEYDWAEVPYPATMQGQAEVAHHGDPDRPAGVLWVPDPEQRHWWREYYIQKPNGQPERQVGFRKPGER